MIGCYGSNIASVATDWFTTTCIKKTICQIMAKNYYSGTNQSRSRWLVAVVGSIVVYYIVCIVDICITDISYDPLFL